MDEISQAEVERRYREIVAYTAAEDPRLQSAVRFLLTGVANRGESERYLDYDNVIEHLKFYYGLDADLVMWTFAISERQIEEEIYLDQA